MAKTKVLNTKIITCNDTSANWASSSKVLAKGEIAIEFPAAGAPKFKIGDGIKTFAALGYTTMTPSEIASAIESASAHANKDILDAITAAFTTEQQTKLAGIATGAQVNVIESVKVNGTALDITSKAVDVEVPTKVSELENDEGYISEYVDTTYELSASKSSTNNNVDLILQGTNSNGNELPTKVRVKGTGATTVTTDASGTVIVDSTNTEYVHPDSGVTAGTYFKTTVNAQGHVTAGENPTTLAGFGIVDAANIQHTHGNADITDLDASKITSGTIDIDRLPAGALEKLVVVADEAARLALTIDEVQNGDTVKQNDTEVMYFVKDDTKLGTADAFEVYTAGSATSVPWSGVTNKPETYPATAHTHAISDIVSLQAELDGKATTAQGAKADTAVQSVKIGASGTELKDGTSVVLPEYPTTLPASDVYDWAKQATKPTYTAAEVGLGNVTNDKQVKGLASGTTAGHVVTFGADGYTISDSGFTIAKSVPADAKFTDTTYDTFVGADGSVAGSAGLVPAPGATDNTKYLDGSGNWSVPTNTDVNVTSTADATKKAYVVGSESAATATGTLIKDTGIYIDTTAGVLVATTFSGNLSGNADTATKLAATKNFSISGGATAAAVAFDGSANVELVVTSLDATLLDIAEGDSLTINGGDASD